MSQLFGPAHQLGFVVRDIKEAMRHWTEIMRVGPFYHFEPPPLAAFQYRGEDQDPQLSVALAYSGGVQIELIEQRNRAPSSFRAFLDAGGEGLHHIGYVTEHYDRDLQRALEAGLRVEQQGAIGDERGKFAHLASGGHRGTVLALIALRPGNRDLFRMIQAEAAHWDGSGPVRRFEF